MTRVFPCRVCHGCAAWCNYTATEAHDLSPLSTDGAPPHMGTPPRMRCLSAGRDDSGWASETEIARYHPCGWKFGRTLRSWHLAPRFTSLPFWGADHVRWRRLSTSAFCIGPPDRF